MCDNACTYQNAQCSRETGRIHRDAVFLQALFGSISDLENPVPFYSECCVLHPHRREERSGLGATKFSTRGGSVSAFQRFQLRSDLYLGLIMLGSSRNTSLVLCNNF